MPIIRAKTPIGKTIGGIFFGCISLAALSGWGSGSLTARVIVGVVFGAVSFVWLSSALKHQRYLQNRSDELSRRTRE
jgi:hypothetical protein